MATIRKSMEATLLLVTLTALGVSPIAPADWPQASEGQAAEEGDRQIALEDTPQELALQRTEILAREEIDRVGAAALALKGDASDRRERARERGDFDGYVDATFEHDYASALGHLASSISWRLLSVSGSITADKCMELLTGSSQSTLVDLLTPGVLGNSPATRRYLGPAGPAPAAIKRLYAELVDHAEEWAAALRSRSGQ